MKLGVHLRAQLSRLFPNEYLALLKTGLEHSWANWMIGIVGVVCGTTLVFFIPYAVDSAIGSVRSLNSSHLWRSCVFIVLIGVLSALLRSVGSFAFARSGADFAMRVRNVLFAGLLRTGYLARLLLRRGDVLAMFIHDVGSLAQLPSTTSFQLSAAVIPSAAAFIFMARLDPILTVLAGGSYLLLYLLTKRLRKTMASRASSAAEALGRLSAKVTESLSAIETIKSFSAFDADTVSIHEVSARYDDARVSLVRIIATIVATAGLGSAALIVLTLFIGGLEVKAGRVSLGVLPAFMVFVYMLSRSATGSVASAIAAHHAAVASSRRLGWLRAFSDEPLSGGRPEQKERGGVLTTEFILSCHGVGYRYPGAQVHALQGVSLQSRARRTIGISGSIGSGKSTLLRLLLKHLEMQEGVICLYGEDIRRMPKAAVRTMIALANEAPIILPGDLRHNLTFGRPGISDSDLMQMATIAGLGGDLLRSSLDLDAQIADMGNNLSGGQRQRLGIARALLGHPNILLLDDALSSVDVETEALILRGIRANSNVQLLIIASHRIASMSACDHILVLRNGIVTEQGTHESLKSSSGFYASMSELQTLETRAERL